MCFPARSQRPGPSGVHRGACNGARKRCRSARLRLWKRGRRSARRGTVRSDPAALPASIARPVSGLASWRDPRESHRPSARPSQDEAPVARCVRIVQLAYRCGGSAGFDGARCCSPPRHLTCFTFHPARVRDALQAPSMTGASITFRSGWHWGGLANRWIARESVSTACCGACAMRDRSWRMSCAHACDSGVWVACSRFRALRSQRSAKTSIGAWRRLFGAGGKARRGPHPPSAIMCLTSRTVLRKTSTAGLSVR